MTLRFACERVASVLVAVSSCHRPAVADDRGRAEVAARLVERVLWPEVPVAEVPLRPCWWWRTLDVAVASLDHTKWFVPAAVETLLREVSVAFPSDLDAPLR